MIATTHDELRALLARYDLRLDLAEHAAWGLALLPGGNGRSTLGGVPKAGPWPINNGFGLTHLASIALEELPDAPTRSLLPRQGTLVFFADFSVENEGWGPADASEPVVEVLYLAPGATVVPAIPPDEARDRYDVPVVLNERSVRFQPVLTLPFLDEIGDALGDRYDDFAVEEDSPDHLLLGEPVYIQEDPRGPGEVSLLQVNWDEDLGFMWGDGGQISFYALPSDLEAGRWERVKAMPDSS